MELQLPPAHPSGRSLADRTLRCASPLPPSRSSTQSSSPATVLQALRTIPEQKALSPLFGTDDIEMTWPVAGAESPGASSRSPSPLDAHSDNSSGRATTPVAGRSAMSHRPPRAPGTLVAPAWPPLKPVQPPTPPPQDLLCNEHMPTASDVARCGGLFVFGAGNAFDRAAEESRRLLWRQCVVMLELHGDIDTAHAAVDTVGPHRLWRVARDPSLVDALAQSYIKELGVGQYKVECGNQRKALAALQKQRESIRNFERRQAELQPYERRNVVYVAFIPGFE